MQRILIIMTLLLSMNAFAVQGLDQSQVLIKLTNELGLTDEQQVETEAAMALFNDEARILHGSSWSRVDKEEQLQKAVKERDHKMQQILDDPQYEQYQRMMTEIRD